MDQELLLKYGNYIRQYPKSRGARDKLKNPC